VMRGHGQLFCCRLGRADPEFTVDLHGVTGDNFSAECLCQERTDLALAAPGRPQYRDTPARLLTWAPAHDSAPGVCGCASQLGSAAFFANSDEMM
jgi:hypothetical protein